MVEPVGVGISELSADKAGYNEVSDIPGIIG